MCLASSNTTYSAEEIALLREKTFTLNDKGEPRETASRLKLADNIQFAFRMYAWAFDVEFWLRKSESGWSDLSLATGVRHRLMHPRKLEDLTVSKTEVEAVSRASAWIDANHRKLQEIAMDKIAYGMGMTAEEIRGFRAFPKATTRFANLKAKSA